MANLSLRIVFALLFCIGINHVAPAQSGWGKSKSKVAIYSTLGKDVDSDFKNVINSYFVTAITNSRDYVVVERNEDFIVAMSQEGDYALENIVKVGQDFKADYVVVIDISKVLGEYFLATRMIDVNAKNGNVVKASNTSGQISSMSQLKSLANEAAQGLLGSATSSNRSGRAGGAGNYNGHEYVDLGLPSGLEWATMNVGASSPSDYGQYFAWGETVQKNDYNENNSVTYNRTMGDISGNPQYDVARAKWGGSWRMPTAAEFEELITYCTWVFTTMGSHNGYTVTGPNGKQIFFPAAGVRYGASLYGAGLCGYYWSSTPYDGSREAYQLYFDSDGTHKVGWSDRYFGRSVRPVTE